MPSPINNLPEMELASVAPAITPAESLLAIVRAIASDSQQQPSDYLDETVVPFGGE